MHQPASIYTPCLLATPTRSILVWHIHQRTCRSRVFPTKSLALLCAGSNTLIWRLHSSLRLPKSIASSIQKLASLANWRRLLFVAAVVGQKFLLPPITWLHMHLLLDSRWTQGATHQIFEAVLLQYPQLHRAHNLTISFHFSFHQNLKGKATTHESYQEARVDATLSSL